MLLHNTYLLGISSLILAAVAAAMRPGKAWRGVAAALALIAIGLQVNVPWIVHDAVGDALRGRGLYQDHAAVQWAIMAGSGLFFLVAAGAVMLRWRGAVRLAWLAVLALVGLCLLQAVSLHQVDAVLARPAGPVMVVALGWLAGAATVVLAALASFVAERRRRAS